MKKLLIGLTLLGCLLLVACAKTQTQSESTTASFKVVEEKEQTESYRYTQDVDGFSQEIIETVTYKGEAFKTLKLELRQPLNDETKTMIASQGLESLKPNLIKAIEEETVIQQLKAVAGVSVSVDVPNETDMVVVVSIDMTTADLTALSKVEGIGFDFTALEDTTPADYISQLKSLGATQVKQ
ncbi:SP0191 family lipoprotein [Streptococcus caprae]|uniref:SP0191 family lipoprotein n=1 Tax=Streptococcus caprae TaxID=1640501 RepID=A0ABV8CU66_9STRE